MADAKAFQLRIYQVKKGRMPDWLTFFRDTLIPLHDLVDLKVRAAWTNTQNPDEFIWIREFESVDAIESKENEFFSTPQRLALGDVRGEWLDSFEVRVVEALDLGVSA